MINPEKIRVGNTPLIKLGNSSVFNSLSSNIYAKLELYNPTGSHKDRESLEIIAFCIKKGIKEVGCASTGNFGISLAYLSNIYQIKCHVWVSNKISPFRESFLKSFGAIIHKVDGYLFDLYKFSSDEMRKKGIYDANPGGNKIKINANQKIFNEINRELPSLDSIITCINNGTHFLGISKAAMNYKISVNAVFTLDERAKSISSFSKYEGKEIIEEMLYLNKGRLIEASSNDINRGLKHAKENGLIIEASSAAVIGVALRLPKNTKNTCCIITGNGVKYPEEIIVNC